MGVSTQTPASTVCCDDEAYVGHALVAMHWFEWALFCSQHEAGHAVLSYACVGVERESAQSICG